MYKYLGIGLLGLFVVMVMPIGNGASSSSTTLFYGAGTIIANDADGNEFFRQTVHNQITDEGESLLIQMVFEDGGTWEPADGTQFGSICISSVLDATLEEETAALFDGGNLLTAKSGFCRTDGDVDNSTVGLAVIESGVFTASGKAGANLAAGEIIDGIAICQAAVAGAGTNSTDCEAAPGDSTGRALAILETSDVTLAESETASITYTFDISDANS